jgi:hypothetical protein
LYYTLKSFDSQALSIVLINKSFLLHRLQSCTPPQPISCHPYRDIAQHDLSSMLPLLVLLILMTRRVIIDPRYCSPIVICGIRLRLPGGIRDGDSFLGTSHQRKILIRPFLPADTVSLTLTIHFTAKTLSKQRMDTC